MMPDLAELSYSLLARDADGATIAQGERQINFVPAVVKRESVSISAATYQAFSIPTGARLLLIKLGTAVSLVLKGNTADVGITLSPATSPLGFDCIIGLGASPTPGILNNGTATATLTLIWL